MRSFTLRAALAALLSLIAVTALAQGGGRGQRFGMFGGGDWGLLRRADVQADLKVTPDQKSKIEAAAEAQRESMRDAFQNFQDMSADERAKAMAKFQEDQKKVYEGILDKTQLGRLKEIGIQIAGNRAVLRPEIQKELALSEEQIGKIKALEAKHQESQNALREKMMNQEIEREEMQAITQKNLEILNTELGKILTGDQPDKLKKLGGAPFKADPNERIR